MTKFLYSLNNFLLTITSITYPLGWLLLESRDNLNLLILIMALLWLLRAVQVVKIQRYFSLSVSSLLVVIYLTRSISLMYWYPVIISGAMLLLFGLSLFSKQTIIERFVRIKEPDLSSQGVEYIRKVTQIWCLFFLFNIFICSGLILFHKYELWALYSGFISYILIALIMLIEWIIRQKVKKAERR